MTPARIFDVRRIGVDESDLMDGVLDTFAEAFDDAETYASNRPSKAYMRTLLASPQFVCLAAISEGTVIGALTAYELIKFEQQRSEFYIYDLAVRESHRRAGVATCLIVALKPIAASRGAKVIFVQADYGDDAAIALYTRLGRREDVMHFDIDTE